MGDMNNRAHCWAAAAAALIIATLSACEIESDPMETGDYIDVRVPDPEPDDRFVDLMTPEFEVPPGTEKQFCYYIDYPDDSRFVRYMSSLQGNYGHHVILLRATEPKPSGTFEDCTEARDMSKLRIHIFPSQELPEGYGIELPEGAQYVIQSHYVNATDTPLLARDVMRVEKTDPASITTWVSVFGSVSLNATAQPGESAVSYDCEVPEDAELLMVGGHMHEHGSRYEISMGTEEEGFETVYLVDPWRPEFRDAPPVEQLYSSPLPLPAGTIVRSTCEWRNTLSRPLEFPEEMCANFMYLAGVRESHFCEPDGLL